MRACLLFIGVAALSAASLVHKIEDIWKNDPAAARAVWGICALDAETGKPLVEYNSTHNFVPASNTKLFTTALALARLGPDFRFRTRITARQAIGPDGVLNADLRLVGDGDPNLSGRALPYQKNSPPGDPLAAIETLVAELERKGLKEVRGEILGDDLAYIWEPYPTGWAVDDTISTDGAPVSALCLNDNEIAVTVRPGAGRGLPAAVLVRPALGLLRARQPRANRPRRRGGPRGGRSRTRLPTGAPVGLHRAQ